MLISGTSTSGPKNNLLNLSSNLISSAVLNWARRLKMLLFMMLLTSVPVLLWTRFGNNYTCQILFDIIWKNIPVISILYLPWRLCFSTKTITYITCCQTWVKSFKVWVLGSGKIFVVIFFDNWYVLILPSFPAGQNDTRP